MDNQKIQDLKDRLERLGTDWHEAHFGPFTGGTSGEVVRLLRAAAVIAKEADGFLRDWVGFARRAGMTWQEIADAIGVSQQAATQRFGSRSRRLAPEAHPQTEIRIRGATLFNECSILEREGLLGRELTGLEPLSLIFRESEKVWEYQRVFSVPLSSIQSAFDAAGWERVASYGPLHYFKRPITSAGGGPK